MNMPLLLKISIGLMVLAIMSKLFAIARVFNINNPDTYVMNIAWIIIFIAIIKGLLKRSNIVRKLTIGLSIIGSIATGIGIFFLITVPLPKEVDMGMAVSLSIAAFLTELFIIFALSSDKVVDYFKVSIRMDAQHQPSADR